MWPFKRNVKSKAADLARLIAFYWFPQVTDVDQLRRDIKDYDPDNVTLALIMGYGCGLAAHIHFASVAPADRNSDVMALAVAFVARHHLGLAVPSVGLAINEVIDRFYKREEDLRICEPFIDGKSSLTFKAGWKMAERDREEGHHLPTRLKEALASLGQGTPIFPPI